MGRKKKPQTLPELYAAKEEAEEDRSRFRQSGLSVGKKRKGFCNPNPSGSLCVIAGTHATHRA